MFQRILKVFQLSPLVFEDVEHDRSAIGQAALVVLIAGILSGLGGAFGALFNERAVLGTLLGSIVWAFTAWFLWALIAYIIGVFLFHGTADLGEMLRTIGFGMAPLWLSIIPCLGGIVGAVWAFIAILIAIRQGLDFDNTKALLTAAVGAVIYLIGFALIQTLGWGMLFR